MNGSREYSVVTEFLMNGVFGLDPIAMNEPIICVELNVWGHLKCMEHAT